MPPRASGVLLHITSLPSEFGIGDLGTGAFGFVDFLHQAKQRLWQILPLGPTGAGNSPYTSFSAFAGNPLLISPETLVKDGFLGQDELPKYYVDKAPDSVDYELVGRLKRKALQQAYRVFADGTYLKEAYNRFCQENSLWLDDYSLFMACKEHFGGKPWNEWPEAIRLREGKAVEEWSQHLSDRVRYHKFTQFLFYRQWSCLRKYAGQKKISIIGDLPIFVAYDSADVWANPHLFRLDEKGSPIEVAGVPPDYFSKTGQLWGNPLYNWAEHEAQKYDWWIRRFQALFALVDIVRVDHFRGYEAYWAVPAKEKTAEKGTWKKGPGKAFLEKVAEELGELPIIAEDLGVITEAVEELRDSLNLPGMRVLQFAFNDTEPNEHLPHSHIKRCVVYTGTHDNDTTVGWFESLHKKAKEYTKKYLNTNAKEISWDLIRAALASPAETAIVPLQDILSLGTSGRMNTPGTERDNWEWRYETGQLTGKLAYRLASMTELYDR